MSFFLSRQELTNALAWFTEPLNKAIEKGQETAKDVADWLWTVIQGDFAEDPSTTQVVTGTVISMIPIVDQICDVRDICANCMKIKEDESNPWAWIGLILTLIGLFPTLGSLFKGIFKVLLAPIRRYVMRPLSRSGVSSGRLIYEAVQPSIESGIRLLNKYLDKPAVRRVISDKNITNIYSKSASMLREVKAELTINNLLKKFDEYIEYLKKTVEYVKRYGSTSIGRQAEQMLDKVLDVRRSANNQLGQVLYPVKDFLERLARRLDQEGVVKAVTNMNNISSFRKISTNKEVEKILDDTPKWVDIMIKEKYRPVRASPTIPSGYPNLSNSGSGPLWRKYNTFHTMEPTILKQGEKLYRVLDPTSNDNSICWMREIEYLKLRNREDWRKRFAVWASWNSNGEYISYIVPSGGMKVWEGITASQILKNEAGEVQKWNGKMFIVEGGGIQIVLDPSQLVRRNVSNRKKTNWGYGSDLDNDEPIDLIGVLTLKTKWYGD